ncbi:hypothetical protein FRC02_004862 [Tulasnella sp. 418]|nr:hypothetical protein FRC02_004862 [Tulasnella sp. 418]
MPLTFRSTPTLPLESLPPPATGTSRTFIETESGRLELLVALPPPDVKQKGPILFIHGGFGSADCYSNYLPYFAAQGYPSYSVSVRGHGHSWYPSYFRMTFLTSRHTFATDLVAALKYIESQHNGQLCALVGHSAGGVEQVKIFESKMPNYESLRWPTTQMRPIARCKDVLRQIISPSLHKPKVLVVAGEHDQLMGVTLMRWMAQQYSSAAGTPLLLDSAKKDDDKPKQNVVNFHVVAKSGHNVMKDLYWEDGARRLLEFLDAID